MKRFLFFIILLTAFYSGAFSQSKKTLNAELDRLKLDSTRMAHSIQSLQTDIKYHEKIIEDKEQIIGNMKSEIQSLNDQVSQLKKDKTDLQASNSKLKNQLDDKKEQISSLKENNHILRHQIDSLRSIINSSANVTQEQNDYYNNSFIESSSGASVGKYSFTDEQGNSFILVLKKDETATITRKGGKTHYGSYYVDHIMGRGTCIDFPKEDSPDLYFNGKNRSVFFGLSFYLKNGYIYFSIQTVEANHPTLRLKASPIH